MEMSRKIIWNQSRDLPAVAQCYNQLRQRMPFVINNVLSKFFHSGVKASLDPFTIFCVQNTGSEKTITFTSCFEL
jgi:hypothetical protein